MSASWRSRRSKSIRSTTHVLPCPAARHAAQWHAHGVMRRGALPAVPFCGDVPAHEGACSPRILRALAALGRRDGRNARASAAVVIDLEVQHHARHVRGAALRVEVKRAVVHHTLADEIICEPKSVSVTKRIGKMLVARGPRLREGLEAGLRAPFTPWCTPPKRAAPSHPHDKKQAPHTLRVAWPQRHHVAHAWWGAPTKNCPPADNWRPGGRRPFAVLCARCFAGISLGGVLN